MKVGCYLTQQAFSGADDGFKARFERANNNKELPGGRTIDFSACQDDGNNPQTNLQIVQKLAQQDGDFAIVGISPNVLTASTDFVARSQVPMYGWGILPGECGNRWFFGFNGCLVTNYPNKKHTVYQANLALGPIEATGQTPAQSKFALQAQDNDTGHAGNETISQLIKLEGAKVVYQEANIPASSAGVSFTPFVQAIKAANPNILLTLTDFQTAPGLTAAMTAGGYTGANVNYVGYIPGLLSTSAQLASAFNGAYVSSQTVPSEENTPYIKQMQKDLTAVNAKTGQLRHAGQLDRLCGGRPAGLAAEGGGEDPQHEDLRPEAQQRELHVQVVGRRGSGPDGVPVYALHPGRLRFDAEDRRHHLQADRAVQVLPEPGEEVAAPVPADDGSAVPANRRSVPSAFALLRKVKVRSWRSS